MESEKLKELQEKYDFDLNKILKDIKKNKAKSVLLQFPDGLKQYALDFVDYFQEKMKKVEFRTYLGSCFGACDIPNTKCDLIIQFGHTKWK